MRAASRLAIIVALAGGAFLPFASPARADCPPPPAGPTVTCAPPGTGGYVDFTGDSVTLTVQPGTTVVDSGLAAILLNDANTVTNNGTISVGAATAGIAVNNDNLLIQNNGSISGGANAAGIFANDRNTIVNAGTITISSGFNSVGISAGVDNIITNSGTISVGNNGNAISTGNNTSLPAFYNIINSGTISAGNNGNGLFVGDNTHILNTGMITVGTNGSAINGLSNSAFPGFDDIVNAGTLNVGSNGNGIIVNDNHSILNSGTIAGVANAVGVNGNNGNTITNTGTITVGTNGSAIQLLGTLNKFFNYGTIKATGGGYTIEACSCTATDNTYNNMAGGTLDGVIHVVKQDNTVNNYGLITITDALTGTPINQFNFTIQNTAGTTAGNPNIFQQFAGGTLAPRMDNTGAIDGLIADQVSLAGTLKVVIQPQLYPSTLTSTNAVVSVTPGQPNAITTFDSFVASSPFFTVTPIYDSGNAASFNNITIQLDRIPFGSVPGLNPNESTVGKALESGYSPNLTGNAATFYANVLSSTSTSVLDQLSGQGTSAAQGASFTAGDLFNAAMLQQGMLWLNGGGTTSGDVSQYAESPRAERKPGYEAFASLQPQAVPEPGRWRAWGLGFGAYHSIEGQSASGTVDQSQHTYGGAIGIDHQVNGDLLVGFAAGGSDSSFAAPALATTGRIDGGHAGVYMLRTFGPAYLAATLNYARLDNTTQRTINAGVTENASGHFASDQLGGRVELGRKFDFGRYTVTPFAAVEPAVLWQHAYSETTGGVMGLNYNANTVTSLPTFLGAQLDTTYALSGGHVLTPFTRVSWVHEFDTARQITASFTSVPGTGFTVDGARASADAVRVASGGTLTLTRTASLFASFESEYSDRSRTYAGTAGVKVVW